MSTFRVVMLTTAIPEEDISEYRVYVNDELEHTFNPTGVPQTEDFTVTGGARGDLMRLAAVRSSDGQEFEEQAATFTAFRPNITRFEQIGDAVDGGDVTVEADVSLGGGAIDRVEVVYDGTTYQLTETATAGTWSGDMPVASGTNDAVCTAFEDSPQGLGSAEETIEISTEVPLLVDADFTVASGNIPDRATSNEWVTDGVNVVYEVPYAWGTAGPYGSPNGFGVRDGMAEITYPGTTGADHASKVVFEFEIQVTGGDDGQGPIMGGAGTSANRIMQPAKLNQAGTLQVEWRDTDGTVARRDLPSRSRITFNSDGTMTVEEWNGAAQEYQQTTGASNGVTAVGEGISLNIIQPGNREFNIFGLRVRGL